MSYATAEMPDYWECSTKRTLEVLSTGLSSRIEERIQGDGSMRLGVIKGSLNDLQGDEYRGIHTFSLLGRKGSGYEKSFCLVAKLDEERIVVNENRHGPSWTIGKKWDRETERCVLVTEEGARTADQICDQIMSDFSAWLSQLPIVDPLTARVFGTVPR